MADIRPLRAIRPRCDMVEQIASLPYDVYSRAEAYALTRNDEHSFLRIDRPETQFSPDQDMYALQVYEKAAHMLRDQIDAGEYVRDDAQCYYVYSQVMNGRRQTGLVAVSSVQNYLDGIIKKHENTRAEKELDRIKHIDRCNAQTGPIFLAYRKSEVIESIVADAMKGTPLYDFEKEQVNQQVWRIDDPQSIMAIYNAFKDMEAIYIADGHHRCASAVKVAVNRRINSSVPTDNSEAEYFLSVLFPDDELMIMDYNRVIKDLKGLSADEFLEHIKKNYEVSFICDRITDESSPAQDRYQNIDMSMVKPTKKGQCSMLLDGKWYSLAARDDLFNGDPVHDLDVSILQDNVLAPVLGIKDPRTDSRIDFVGGIRGLEELERRCDVDCKVAFAMYPTDIQELFSVADAGLLMPPKSTWFEPKLLSGIFIHDLEQ